MRPHSALPLRVAAKRRPFLNEVLSQSLPSKVARRSRKW